MTTASLPRRPGWPARPGGWLGRLGTVVAGTAAVVVVAGLCSRVGASHYGTTAIEAVLFVPVWIATFRRPLLAIFLMLAVVSSIFNYGSLPRLNVPGHPPINLADLLLAAAVGGTLWRRPWKSWPIPAKRYLLVLTLFLALASVASIKTALTGYVPAREAAAGFRNFLFLGAALTVALELRSEQFKPLLNLLIALAAVIAALSIAAAASSSVAHALTTFTPWSVNNQTLGGGSTPTSTVSRVRVEGLFLVYTMLIPTLAMVLLVKDRWRWARLVALLLMLGAIGVSLNRNMYAGAAVGLILTALLGGSRLRLRLGLTAVVVITTVALVVLTSVVPSVTAEVGKRASTLTTPSQLLSSASLTDRKYELSFALPSIGRHPWFGVGPEQFYGAYNSLFSTVPRTFVQNFYIDVATDYGIPTALGFLLIAGFCLATGVRSLPRSRDPVDRALLASFIGALVAMLLSLLVGTYLQGPDSTAAFAVGCGLLLACALRSAAPSGTVMRRPPAVEHSATTSAT